MAEIFTLVIVCVASAYVVWRVNKDQAEVERIWRDAADRMKK